MVVTNKKPDIVIIDDKKKETKLFELTCPMEHNIHKVHKYKLDKYTQFETDIKTHKTTVCAFKVGSRGTLTNENLARLSSLHKYLKKHIKKELLSKTLRRSQHSHPIISSQQERTRPGTIQPLSTPRSRIQITNIQ